MNPPMKDWEKAWLACAVDGEGSIIMQMDQSGVVARLLIYNTKKEFCDFAKTIVGDGIVYSESSPRGNRAISHMFVIRRYATLRRVLEEIRPFVVIKQQQVGLMLEFLSAHRFHAHRTADEDMRESALMNRCKSLNMKGRQLLPENDCHG